METNEESTDGTITATVAKISALNDDEVVNGNCSDSDTSCNGQTDNGSESKQNGSSQAEDNGESMDQSETSNDVEDSETMEQENDNEAGVTKSVADTESSMDSSQLDADSMNAESSVKEALESGESNATNGNEASEEEEEEDDNNDKSATSEKDNKIDAESEKGDEEKDEAVDDSENSKDASVHDKEDVEMKDEESKDSEVSVSVKENDKEEGSAVDPSDNEESKDSVGEGKDNSRPSTPSTKIEDKNDDNNDAASDSQKEGADKEKVGTPTKEKSANKEPVATPERRTLRPRGASLSSPYSSAAKSTVTKTTPNKTDTSQVKTTSPAKTAPPLKTTPQPAQGTVKLLPKAAPKPAAPVVAAAAPAAQEELEGPDGSNGLRATAKFFYSIGMDIAREHIYNDLIRLQTRRLEQNKLADEEKNQLEKLKNAYEGTKQKNTELKLKMKRCPKCHFKTESENVMEFHRNHPHLVNQTSLSCFYCDFACRQPLAFSFHMEAEHNRQGYVEPRSAFWQCELCGYEHNNKSMLMKHKAKCEKNFKLVKNLLHKPFPFEEPIHKRYSPPAPNPTPQTAPSRLLQPQAPQRNVAAAPAGVRYNAPSQIFANTMVRSVAQQPSASSVLASMITQPQLNAQYQYGNSMFTLVSVNGRYVLQPAQSVPYGQVVVGQTTQAGQVLVPPNLLQQRPAAPTTTSIVTTPQPIVQPKSAPPAPKPAPIPTRAAPPSKAVATSKTPTPARNSKQFEVCEICGGFVKDRDSLRIHFYWAHKVDIQKEIFERKQPHLTCEQCTLRFWTYQGLMRHRQSTGHSANAPQTPTTPKPSVQPMECYICGATVTHILNHMSSIHSVSLKDFFNAKKCFCCGGTAADFENHLLWSHGFHVKLDKMSGLFTVQRVWQKNGNQMQQLTSWPEGVKAPPSNTPIPVGLYANTSKQGTLALPPVEAPKLMHKCHRCPFKCSIYSALVKHRKRAHMKDKEQCPLCGKSFMIGFLYVKHMKDEHLKECSINLKRLGRALMQNAKAFSRSLSGAVKRKAPNPEPVVILDSDEDDEADVPLAKLTPKSAKMDASAGGGGDEDEAEVVEEGVDEAMPVDEEEPNKSDAPAVPDDKTSEDKESVENTNESGAPAAPDDKTSEKKESAEKTNESGDENMEPVDKEPSESKESEETAKPPESVEKDADEESGANSEGKGAETKDQATDDDGEVSDATGKSQETSEASDSEEAMEVQESV